MSEVHASPVLPTDAATAEAVPSITAADLEQLARWNATERPFEQGLRLGDLIRRTVARDPEGVALRYEGRDVTYAELDRRAVALAMDLRSRGIGPGALVGVCVDRSLELVTAVVGIVYSGGAYVPLDPSYPQERLADICEDAAMTVVVSRPEEMAKVGDAFAAGRQVVLVDCAGPTPAPVADFELVGTAEDPAYVIFTSGSTGRPKGAMNAHSGIVNRLLWMLEDYPPQPGDRIVHKSPYSFDVSVWEFFWSLTCGVTLVIARAGGHRVPSYVAELLRRERITIVHFVPSMLRIFLDEPDLDTLADVRLVVCSGEALPKDLADRFFERMPQSRLLNLYGPTEAAVEATWYECYAGDPRPFVSIGVPMANTRIYVLDKNKQHVPIGAEGVIYIAGVQVGMGYASRPELTAERFTPDPFRPGERMYDTGDSGRWLPEGVLEYLGRTDQMMKVNGYRIEAGEIEVTIRQTGLVKDVVVTAPEIPGAGQLLLAHIVLNEPGVELAPLFATLYAEVRKHLPEYMVPARFIPIEALPLTASGKIDRRALPLPKIGAAAQPPAKKGPGSDVREIWEDLVGVTGIAEDQNLFDLGARSIMVTRFIALLKERGIEGLTVADVYDRPTIGGMTAALTQGAAASGSRQARGGRPAASGGIAIVGMATRTAGGKDLEAFWENLIAGREGIRHFAPHELDPSVPESVRNRPNFVPARGVLEDVGRFDAGFFGLSARDAMLLDPQQRLLLELSWSALEHAGIDPSRGDTQKVGVYAGIANNSYAIALREEQPELVRQLGEFVYSLSMEKDYVATRVAHRLDLKGPAISVHTACSTGLVAVAQACQGLADGQCDVALAGGSTVLVPQESGYLNVEGGMDSADGHCRPFDADANGTVFSSGGAVVVLKRLEDAVEAGDEIYAVIRGCGINNDGAGKASFTAPSVSGQAAAIRMALEQADIDARSIGYVEAHGTGTSLGDPIEIAALTRAWSEDTQDRQFCRIGSVKGNLGHTIAAAGTLGLVKAALALHREVIPGTLHFRRPNPQIDFASTPFEVVSGTTAWPRGTAPRRAAVSSFGVGGTNAHVVIEEGPRRATARTDAVEPSSLALLPLSAHSQEALLARAEDLADWLESHGEVPLTEVAATLMRGRKAMAQRQAVVARDRAQAIAALRGIRSATVATAQPRLVFVFPGQGSQHPGMARGLYEASGAFRDALDRCLEAAGPQLAAKMRGWLLEAAPGDEQAAAELAETRHAQPALFSVSYALAAWLESLGLRPQAAIGHSIGEYAAACHAGVFTPAEAMAAVIARGEAMYAQPHGAMLAVKASADDVRPLLADGVEIAGCNAPALTVVAGSHAAIDAFERRLAAADIGTTRLKVSHGFHSKAMEGALPQIETAIGRTKRQAPVHAVYSCVTGEPLTTAQIDDPGYWARQVRQPVMFGRCVEAELALAAKAQTDAVFVEVGPGQALTALLRQHRTARGQVPRTVALLGPAAQPGDAAATALAGIGSLWCAGVAIAWPVASGARRATLPTYPFRGERYWYPRRDFDAVAAAAATAATAQPATVTAMPALTMPPPTVVPVSADAMTPSAPAIDRRTHLTTLVAQILADVSGIPAEDLTPEASFVEQGLDSLSLTQATLELERVFGVKLRFRRLLEDLSTPQALAAFLDAELPADRFAPPAPVVPAIATAATTTMAPMPMSVPQATAVAMGGPLQQLIAQQLQLMAQQIALMSGQIGMPMTAPLLPIPQPIAAAAPALAAPASPAGASAAAEGAQPSIKALVEKPFGASARIVLEAKNEMTPAQREWLADFIRRYNERTGRSKDFSQRHRRRMADPRVVTGFNPQWKDLVYPIVVDRSKGAYLWDLDGNRYIDLLSCFGANLLGYQPDDLLDAMIAQLKSGIEVGPQHPMAAEVAELISEFTGMERVGFCNTGSEAVMGAMRTARTVTGRKTIAIFANSYHGIFDEVVVRGTKQLRSLSAAPGILANAVENILVVDWNSEESLRILRERGPQLAAIMIEPIQNKYPHMQPREFVQQLREICDEAGCALIFDEVVTGFRVAPGGAQEFYGIRADIATYGKVIGGGISFAAIAGSAHWLDALDGGHWQYGDDSYPEAGVTYFAGTFVRHPLALAAARASLLHLKRGGPELYRHLNQTTQGLIERLNDAFAARGAPVKAVHCASLWRLAWDDDQRYVSLFYYIVRYHGLHIYEQFGHFVTEAMGQTEVDRICSVFIAAVDELMALGLLTPRQGTPGGGGGGQRITNEMKSAPLTPGQTERWLVASFDERVRRALNESICITLAGDVNRPALRAALQDVIARHETFRIRFDRDEPRQILEPARPMPIKEVDLRHLADADAALDAYGVEASQHDFALDQAPVAMVALLELSDGRVAVHVEACHMVLDGWAASVFSAELGAAYQARLRGARAELPPAESPLVFAQQEHQRAEGPEGQAALEYWSQVLKDPPAQLMLGDRAPATPRPYGADTVRTRMDADALARLRTAARERGATLFHLLLTAVTVLLRQRSGQPDFVVSIPYASQNLGRHGPLMADGVLDLPLRLTCEPEETGTAVLSRIRSQMMDALEYPLVTQGSVARALGVRSLGDRPPLTGIFFNLNPRVDLQGFAPLKAEIHEGRKRSMLNDLFFNFYEKPDGLTLDLQHSTDYFSREQAQGLIDELVAICERLTISLDGPVLPPPHKREGRVDEWISRQAAATPDAPAVTVRGRTLSYRALEARAQQFANALTARGVAAGDLVGLCLGRGSDLLPALLGVLKVGAAYVPLDPGFPAERLRYMAEDARLRLVITEAVHASLSGLPQERQLRIDDDAAEIATAPAVVARAAGSEADTAYVIYTSGSTGKPKGVVLPHGAVLNFLESMRREPGLAASDRLLAVTTLSFDIAVLELLLPLTLGAQVVIAQRDDAMDGEALARLIDRHGITVMQATPTTWHLLLDAGWRAPVGFRAYCGGEPMPAQLAKRLLAQGIELWNLYGPTETTVWSTVARITDAADITVGRAIDATTLALRDERGAEVPVGAEGEICIGGAGVATGYWNRPDLTAEKFVLDAAGRRYYRTGDLGRFTPDGRLVHLGRIDSQIKLRGYRIELGEIESQLAALPGVSQAVVAVQEEALVGFVVPVAGQVADPAGWRQALRATLPDYMLPQQIRTLAALPLLPNGKIDRKALPSLGAAAESPSPQAAPARAPTAPAAVPATGASSTAVAAIGEAMAAVLRRPSVGPREHFFELGGHSLLAARLATRIGEALGQRPSLRQIFEAPTPEALAASLLGEAAGDAPAVKAALEPIPTHPDQSQAPLTLMQERIRFVEQLQPGRVMYNLPAAVRLEGPLDVEVFRRALQQVVQRQSALRVRISPEGEGGEPVMSMLHALPVGLPYEDLSALPEAEREAECQRRMQRVADTPFHLGRAPLFRAQLFKLGVARHVFLFVGHHIAWDGASFELLCHEMAEIYGKLSRGEEAALAPLAVSYGDYARWQRQWMDSEAFQAELGWWKHRFDGAALVSPLPTDRPRGAGKSGRGAFEWLHLDAGLVAQLRELGRRADATVNMVAIAVYAALIASIGKSASVVIGMPVRGRGRAEFEPVMGFFNNTLPLQFDVVRQRSVIDAIGDVRSHLLEAFSHQDVPFERLAVEPEFTARSQKAGVYQALFAYEDARERPGRWGELRATPARVSQSGATEDLGLWLTEVADGIEGDIIYNADIYDAATAAAFRDRFVEMLRAAATDGAQPMGELMAAGRSSAAALLQSIGQRRTEPSSSSAGVEVASAGPSSVRGTASAMPAAVSVSVTGLTSQERALAEIWSALVGVPTSEIRAGDNFFDLGGDSLLAMRAIDQAAAAFGVRVDPRRYVFESLAQLVGNAATDARPTAAGPAPEAAPHGGLVRRMFGFGLRRGVDKDRSSR